MCSAQYMYPLPHRTPNCRVVSGGTFFGVYKFVVSLIRRAKFVYGYSRGLARI